MPENVRVSSYPPGAWCPDQDLKCAELTAQLKLNEVKVNEKKTVQVRGT